MALAVIGVLAMLPLQARELAVPPADLLPAELVAVRVVPELGMAVMLLRVGGNSELPIFTGMVEAEAIERARRKLRAPRPQTHDLLADTLAATGWTLERLVIDELREGQFMAALDLRHRDGSRRLIDSRPSDGIALAMRDGRPILVARQVLEAAAAEETRPPPEGVITTQVTQPLRPLHL
jgi:uncharacterized protein